MYIKIGKKIPIKINMIGTGLTPGETVGINLAKGSERQHQFERHFKAAG